jgi:hypothetical protein
MNWNPYLIGNIYLGGYVFLNYFALTVVLCAMFLTVFSIALLIKSGSRYSVQDAEAHAQNYGGDIREGHGGMTVFLWILFTFLFVWTVVYFAQHAPEFGIWFAY